MEIFLIIGLALLTIGLWFWAMIEIAKSRFINPNFNTIWLLIVLFFPILVSIFYFQIRKKLVANDPRVFQPNCNRTV